MKQNIQTSSLNIFFISFIYNKHINNKFYTFPDTLPERQVNWYGHSMLSKLCISCILFL